MASMTGVRLIAAVLALAWQGFLAPVPGNAQGGPADDWRAEWPKTDFVRHTVDLGEIRSGGPPKDGIPAIDAPRFDEIVGDSDLPPTEPVIVVTIDGDTRAYPLRILTWHEIVNDSLAGVPILVTYCPLCNSAIVFERTVNGRVLDFGTTGKLRNSDLVMHDRQTESWWQQYTGQAIVGILAGTTLTMRPSRVEAFGRFASEHPNGKMLVPNDPGLRRYGVNPYRGYDGSPLPFLYDGSFPEGIAPMAYVVVVENQAWSLKLLRRDRRIEAGNLVLTWEPGQSSALDSEVIADGRDIGNVVVQRRSSADLTDVLYSVTFAFVFHAFQPDGVLHQ